MLTTFVKGSPIARMIKDNLAGRHMDYEAREIDNFKEMISRVKVAYPNASIFATTLREVVNANRHLWGAIMAEGDRWHVVEPRQVALIDRIGGGDGFVGGMLYAFP